jgi:hypothetical protein
MTGCAGRPVAGEGISVSQTSGCNPSLYTNLKKKGAKKAPKK